MLKRTALCLLVLCLLAPSASMAFPPSPWTQEATDSDKALAKLKFGLTNLLFGWTEIFSEPYEAWESRSNIFEAVGNGIAHAILDTVGGAAHVVTSPVPAIDLPLPEGGTDTFK